MNKDKKTLKEIATELRTSFEECPNIIAIMHRFEKEDIQAISNEISELETYKKIAEKLAEQLEKDYTNCKCCKNLIRHSDMFECKEFANKKQCIIDWARKEVAKDGSTNADKI